MKRINLLLTFLSITTILVTLERYAATNFLLSQQINFLQLHEIIQIAVIIPLNIVLAFLLLKTISHNYETIKGVKGTLVTILFMVGIYFSATGNGIYEVASVIFNNICALTVNAHLCGSAFFNDYYLGNIMYFIGTLCWTIAIVILERIKPSKHFTGKDMAVTLANGFFFGLTIFAYAAFDRVLVGLFFSAIAAIIICIFLFAAKTKYANLPFTTYCAIAYTGATLASLVVRLR